MTTTRTRTALASLSIAAVLLAGCGSDDDTEATSTETTEAPAGTDGAATDELQIDDVWARQSPMGTTAGAIYLQVTSPVDDQLLAASVPTDVAGTTEVHETVIGDDDMGEGMGGDDMGDDMGGDDMGEGMGSMTMREVDSIDLPAGETVTLEPGGLHIMLLDLVAPLEVGQTIELTLTFAEAGERTVTAEVREG